MAQSVRKIDGDRVEVLFDKALDVTAGPGKSLDDFAAGRDDMDILRDDEGRAIGVQTAAKTYIQFLQSVNVSDATIKAFRFALDDSKKAVRERQRAPRRPR